MNIKQLQVGQLYVYVRKGKSKKIVRLTEINENIIQRLNTVTRSVAIRFNVINNSQTINLTGNEVVLFIHDKQKYEAQFLKTIKDIYEY